MNRVTPWQLVWTHMVLILASMAALYPILWVLLTALSPGQSIVGAGVEGAGLTLTHFDHLLSERNGEGQLIFGRQLFNSLVVAGATTVVGLTLSATAGYAFSRFRFVGRDAGLKMLMLTQIFPGVVMLIPLYILLDTMGLVNTLTGLVVVYSTSSVPFCTWMLKGQFDTIPNEIEEAALVDGASDWVMFTRIALPLARPGIAITALFSFMTAWNEFILAATLLNDASSYTLPVALQQQVGAYQTNWGTFAAGAILVSIPVMLLFYALQKHMVGGLMAGGVKG